MIHCNCPTCKLNGMQGRPHIKYSGQQYCTAHPQYVTIKRYKQVLNALGLPNAGSEPWSNAVVCKPTVVTPPTKRKPVMDTYILSFRDEYNTEQDWFIMADDDEEASDKALVFLSRLPYEVKEYSFVKETHVNFIRLLNR